MLMVDDSGGVCILLYVYWWECVCAYMLMHISKLETYSLSSRQSYFLEGKYTVYSFGDL